MQKETLSSLSERTKFSASTISRVLSGQAKKYRISEKTIEIITREARKCNYTPSLLAQSLRTNKTNTLGLLIPGVDSPYFSHIASIIIHEAKKCGYQVIIIDTMENEEREHEGIQSLLSRKVDGILIAPSGRDATHLESISAQTPIVLIDRHFESTTLPFVCTNNRQGGREATELLIRNGHSDILCIQGVNHSMPSRERVLGYMDALKEADIESRAMVAGNDFSIRNGYLETKLAMNMPKPPTAIFTLSNTILLGAIKALRELKLNIPEDVSIVSFDNNTYLDFLNPAITRVSQQSAEIGTLAVRILMQRIAGVTLGEVRIQQPPEMIICNSVRRL